MTYVSARRALI